MYLTCIILCSNFILCFSTYLVWLDTCVPTVYAFHCGLEVKEAIRNVYRAHYAIECRSEILEKIQPLVQHFEALVIEQQKLKQIKSSKIKMFQAV